jgi:glucose/arabinose dehydrogenase
MRRPHVSTLAGILSILCLIAAPTAASAAPTFTNPSFESVPLASGLDLPTDVTWAPDGRMFIAEKEGYVRVVEPDGTLLPKPIVDIHDHVLPYGDRGLIGIAAAPIKESTDIRLYLLYDHGSPKGTSTETLATATLTWVTVHADDTVIGGANGVNPTETTVLGKVNEPGTIYGSACASENIDCIPADGFTHSIGTILVDPNDGSLWVGSGDGLNDFEAEEGEKASPLHIRAQDPESLAGKILHIHTDGTGFEHSPFCPSDTNLKDNCTKVWGDGFRNPFRFTLRSVSGQTLPVVGDVGEGHWEEVDLPLARGFNGGWPCYEGNEANSDFTGTPQCLNPTTPFDAPLFVYTHYNDECTYPEAPKPCDTNNEPGAAVASAGFYAGESYPAEFRGKLFVADYVNGWISAVNAADPPPTGYSSGKGMPLFAQHLGELVDVTQAPSGNLVYVTLSVESETARGLGTVREIRYAPSGKSPVAEPTADSSCVNSSVGSRKVSFNGDDSYDPDGDASLSYHWEFGDGESSSQPDPTHLYAADGDYEARLTVTDSQGNSASDFLAIHIHEGQAGQPRASITAPELGEQYLAGTNVKLAGNDESAGASSQWQVVKYDGSNLVSALPPIETGDQGDAQFATDASPAHTIHYELHFVASNGTCATTVSSDIGPQTGRLNLVAQDEAGDPLAVPLTFGGEPPSPAPTQLTVVKNMEANLSAPETFINGGYTYTFSSWSDGNKSASREVQPYPDGHGEDPQTLTATYTKSDRPPVASIDSPANGSTFVSGQQITVNGSATDPEDGAEPGEHLAWTIVRHANGAESNIAVPNGSAATFIPDAAGDPQATYSISLTATDSHGLVSGPASITLQVAQAAGTPGGSSSASNPPGSSSTLGVPSSTDSLSSLSNPAGSSLITSIPGSAASLNAVAPRVSLDRLKPKPTSLSGIATDAVGISRLQLAIRPQNVRGRACLWWSTKQRRLVQVASSCAHPSWLTVRLPRANGTVHWTLALGARLPRGRYLLLVRAVNRAGRTSTRLEGDPSGRFTVR